MKIEVNNPCCLCDSCESHLLFEIEYPNHNYPGKFLIRECESCGLLFNSPRLTDIELANLYGENYYFFDRNDSDEFRRVASIYLRTVALLQGEIEHMKVLEVGSAKGYLLALLKHLGWEVQGIEISPEASQYARDKFDLSIFTGHVEQYLESNNREKFPLILAIDVLEHVPNPVDFIGCMDSVLEEDGLLIIDTPNGNAKNIKVVGSAWKGFNPFHIYLFSIESLGLLLKKNGYTIEMIFSYGNSLQEEQDNLATGPRVSLKSISKSALRYVLGKFGLLNHTKKAYSKFRKHTYAQEENRLSFSDAAKTIETSPPYLESEDAHAILAAELKGDNIVMIARKCA